jgi:hypothetical protein
MKMIGLVSCHLSRDVKKKRVFQVFLRLICLEPISLDSDVLSPFIFRPICFKAFFYKSYQLLQTHKSSVDGKTTTNEAQPKTWTISILSPSNQGRQHHMGFYRFCQMPHGSWRASPTGQFGLFHANSPIKGHLKTLRGRTNLSPRKFYSPLKICNPFSSVTNISCLNFVTNLK